MTTSPSPPCHLTYEHPFALKANAIIRAALARRDEKVVVVDDDPTGTQAFRDIPVHFEWSVETLAAALRSDEAAGFFLTTNSRGLPEAEAIRINRAIGTNLRAVETLTGRRCHLVSRSDSTLRGHFPAELVALVFGYRVAFHGVLVAPFFHEGGRVTRENTHYIRKSDADVPVAETEFARDPVFPYATSHLPDWIEEKSKGDIRADDVQRLSLACIRTGGPEAVAAALRAMPAGSYCVINAETPIDMTIATAGAVLAERSGRRFIWRSAASAAQARLAQTAVPLVLDAAELQGRSTDRGGLVIVGSHVQATTRQLMRLLQQRGDAVPIKIDVDRLIGDEREHVILSSASDVDAAIEAGRIAVVYTSRDLARAESDDAFLFQGERITAGLSAIVRSLRETPAFVIAKGGITSHCIARDGLRLRTAWVRGALLPGVPVWRCPPDSRWPALDYVVFPGNVGADDALFHAVQRLTRS